MNYGVPVATRKALLDAARLPKAKRASQRLQVLKDSLDLVQTMGPRSFRFTISTGTIDRAADVVRQSGWDLRAYRRNPVVLLEHGYHPVLGTLPIGRTVEIGIEGGKLKATVLLDAADTPITGVYAEMVRVKLAAGSLSACSVSFRPIDFDIADGRNDGPLPGFDFFQQELTEWSIVSVPCNPETLVEAGPAAGLSAALAPVSNGAPLKTQPGTNARRLEIALRFGL